MPKPRVKMSCPWCGAILERMAKADRIKEKRGPGSRIEKNVARCPECLKIIQLNKNIVSSGWRAMHVAAFAAGGGIALLVVVGIAILIWRMRT